MVSLALLQEAFPTQDANFEKVNMDDLLRKIASLEFPSFSSGMNQQPEQAPASPSIAISSPSPQTVNDSSVKAREVLEKIQGLINLTTEKSDLEQLLVDGITITTEDFEAAWNLSERK